MQGVPKQPTWPADDFNRYLEELMRAQGITDRAELARLSGVSNSQFSTWKKGTYRPSKSKLEEIAPYLGVPVRNLLLKAGIVTPEELGLDAEPEMPVLPRVLRELIDTYAELETKAPELVEGFEDRLRDEMTLVRAKMGSRKRKGS